ncbi:hypothetical protein KP509_06G067300 [Ceratopteris richardii]|uniref:Glycosyl hydrolase family 13 catalytic domain-containing protein n=1 Tax=Ceratopteris richardii TaxID=49495 RepID=A0A8T2UQ48_CERRI|nr:hypothetical protein KP509_06G067300 [Ceratopteris richardii]
MAMSGLSYAGSVANGLDFYSSRPLVPVRTQPCGASPGSSVGAGYFKLIDYVKQHELSVKPLRLSTSGAGRNVQNAASSEEEVSTLNATKYREPQKVFKERTNIYNYDPEIGKKVVAKVRKEGNIYKLKIEASFSEEETLCMEWDTFRSKSSGWKEPVLKELPVGTIQLNEGYQSTLQRVDSSNLCVELEFMSDLVPFYVRFRIFQASNKHADVPSARDSHFICPIGCGRGCPDPLGSTVRGDGSINFALYSQRASAVILCLYHEGNPQPLVELELQRSINKTGNTWHIELDGNMYDRYGYKCMGESSWEKGDRFHARRILLDPYAKIVAPFLPGQDSLPSPAVLLGLLSNDKEFEWGDDTSPNIPLEETVAYRLNIGGFTGDKSSGLPDHILGTFEGLANKSEHLKALGVNCIILQPIFYFKKKKGAYHPLSFFAPMDIFGPERTCASSSYSLKKAIRELHKNHIEVLLDVVFSHTGENNDESPENISFRGIDNATYYILDQDGRVTRTDLGSENSFNCNHPVAHSMIVDCLRHWVLEYHVDGFFFINSSALTKGPHREELTRPLLVEAISFDPILSKCKLLADISSPFTGTYKVRNYLMCLFLSQGIPVLNMGDEYGLSKGGSLAIDQRRSFNWDALKLDFGQQMSQLIASLGAFRARRADLFQRKEFLKLENIQWHGLEINQPDWENTERSFIAMSLMPEETVVDSKTGGRDIYVGFNSGDAAVVALIPDPPPGMDW